MPRRIRAETAKKCTKKRDARAKLLFCQSKPIAFLPFSLPFPSSLLNYFFPDKQGPHTSSPLPRTLLHKTQRGPLDALKNTDKCIIESVLVCSENQLTQCSRKYWRSCVQDQVTKSGLFERLLVPCADVLFARNRINSS